MAERKMTKGRAFVYGLVALVVVVVIVALRVPEDLGNVARAAFAGIAGLVGLYSGAQAADNGLKGKYYRPELDRWHEGK